jgi:hypothetical protein
VVQGPTLGWLARKLKLDEAPKAPIGHYSEPFVSAAPGELVNAASGGEIGVASRP